MGYKFSKELSSLQAYLGANGIITSMLNRERDVVDCVNKLFELDFDYKLDDDGYDILCRQQNLLTAMSRYQRHELVIANIHKLPASMRSDKPRNLKRLGVTSEVSQAAYERRKLEPPATVFSGAQFTLWMFNDGEHDRFFPGLNEAEAAAVAFLKGNTEWSEVDIQCFATQPMSNHAICDMLDPAPNQKWMVGLRIYETLTGEGEIVDRT